MSARIIPFSLPEGQGQIALDNTPVSRTQATVLRKALQEGARIRASQETEGKPDGLAVAGMEGELKADFFIAFGNSIISPGMSRKTVSMLQIIPFESTMPRS